MEKVQFSIIGAGVVGLAVAESLSQKYADEVIVFEKNDNFGQETSSRNSEVIHAGIYYPKGSLKSRLCLEGNPLLYEFCGKENVKHKRCGKLIISTNSDEAGKIGSIYQRASEIGVPGLRLIEKDEIAKLEPDIHALNGIFSETTGIIDSHALMSRLHGKAAHNGVLFTFCNGVTGIIKTKEGYVVQTVNEEEILAKTVINCAGLSSDKVAALAGFDLKSAGYKLHYCKGDYFSVAGSKGRISHLVYPVPHEKGYGLGVHATLDLDGYIRLGPDTTYVDEISYDVDASKRGEFFSAAHKYFPWLKETMLTPDTSGMRPKLQGPDDGVRDFVINEESARGYPGFINLIGIESPGLTSCLAIAKYVMELVGRSA